MTNMFLVVTEVIDGRVYIPLKTIFPLFLFCFGSFARLTRIFQKSKY